MPSQIMQQQDTLSYPLKPKLSSEQAPIEKLPTELLRLGTEALVQDSNPYDAIQHDLLSCLLTSHKLHETAIPLVYRNVKFSKASTFQKFLVQLSRYPSLGKNVQRLDLSELTGEHIPSAETLERCLSLTPMLRGFLAPPEIDLDEVSLRRLLCDLPYLQLLSFEECSSVSFNEAFASVFEEGMDTSLKVSNSITHLNLHGCSGLPCHVFEDLLPQLPKLEQLDVSGTNITDEALASISSTAKITHLNISNSPFLSSHSVAQTISTHTSFTSSLVSLNAETKPAHADATFGEEDLSLLLPNLPSTLKSLNLKRSIMTPEHIPHLQKLSTHLEELHVGTDLRLQDLESLFVPPQIQIQAQAQTLGTPTNLSIQDPTLSPPLPTSTHSAPAEKSDAVLSHMEQAVAVCKIRRLLNSIPLPDYSSSSSTSSSTTAPNKSTLRLLDISSMSIFQQRKITNSVLLGEHSLPLERIEVSEEVFLMCKVLGRVCGSVGWGVVWDGRRCGILRGESV